MTLTPPLVQIQWDAHADWHTVRVRGSDGTYALVAVCPSRAVAEAIDGLVLSLEHGEPTPAMALQRLVAAAHRQEVPRE